MLAVVLAVAAVGAVQIYDDKTFDSTVSTGVHFVDFFAPWCGHCKQLEPTWKRLASTFANDASISIAKVDATVEAALASRMSVESFPTLLLFANGSKYEYGGGRSSKELKAFVRGGYKSSESSWYASKWMYMPIQKVKEGIQYCKEQGPVHCMRARESNSRAVVEPHPCLS